jgi:collagen triple helix repeat protein
MFERFHKHVGTAGLVVAIVALVAALGGGAYAATGGSSGAGKATASAKAKQGKQGKPGKAGAQGPAGPVGPAGPQGAAGPKGDTGAAGSNGTNGTNGATGATGATGAAGTTGFTATLPEEAMETGTWQFASNGESRQYVPISFPIPLAEADAGSIAAEGVGFTQPAGSNPSCPGTSVEPKAEPGFLCIYAAKFQNTLPGLGLPADVFKPTAAEVVEEEVEGEKVINFLEVEEEGVATSGTLLFFEEIEAGKHDYGTFAVTAP